MSLKHLHSSAAGADELTNFGEQERSFLSAAAGGAEGAGIGIADENGRRERTMNSPEPQPPLVLVVDDVAHGRAMCAEYLAERGFRVATAEDGLDAFDTALALQPDVILMDLSLPVLDGWEVTGLLKRTERTRTIPIVALTAHLLPSAHERAREAGCSSVMVKPCPPRDLEAELRRHLAPPRAA